MRKKLTEAYPADHSEPTAEQQEVIAAIKAKRAAAAEECKKTFAACGLTFVVRKSKRPTAPSTGRVEKQEAATPVVEETTNQPDVTSGRRNVRGGRRGGKVTAAVPVIEEITNQPGSTSDSCGVQGGHCNCKVEASMPVTEVTKIAKAGYLHLAAYLDRLLADNAAKNEMIERLSRELEEANETIDILRFEEAVQKKAIEDENAFCEVNDSSCGAVQPNFIPSFVHNTLSSDFVPTTVPVISIPSLVSAPVSDHVSTPVPTPVPAPVPAPVISISTPVTIPVSTTVSTQVADPVTIFSSITEPVPTPISVSTTAQPLTPEPIYKQQRSYNSVPAVTATSSKGDTFNLHLYTNPPSTSSNPYVQSDPFPPSSKHKAAPKQPRPCQNSSCCGVRLLTVAENGKQEPQPVPVICLTHCEQRFGIKPSNLCAKSSVKDISCDGLKCGGAHASDYAIVKVTSPS